MNKTNQISRREFLKVGAAAGSGFLLSFYLPAFSKGENRDAAEFVPNAFIRIDSDDTVTVIVNHSEMGQGTYTSLPMIVAEELDADWEKVEFETAPVDPTYNHPNFGSQITVGSSSVIAEWDRLRKAGATARAILVAAAAQTWGVEDATCRTEEGLVIHDPSGRKLSYGQLAAMATEIDPPSEVSLKEKSEFKLIGKPLKRLDSPQKIDGSAVFGIDVKIPGMLTAVVARPPVIGGKVRNFNSEKAIEIPGVKHVVEIDRGIAIVAEGFWPAKKGRDALEVEWDDGPLADLDSKTQRKEYAELAEQPGPEARKEGDVRAANEKSAEIIDSVYEFPYLAHAPMEPLNCVADVRSESCEIWTGTQGQTAEHQEAVKITGLNPDQVTVHTKLLGGAFGRRVTPDNHFVQEAVQVSKEIQKPVKVVWTREDDIQGGYYRPDSYHKISSGLDTSGKPLSWHHRIVCPAIFDQKIDSMAVGGAINMPYSIPNVQVEWKKAKDGVPVQWWRSVGSSYNAFVVESFIDELAVTANKDPVEYRRMLLESPRYMRVLDTAAKRSGWKESRPPGRGQGIAIHEYSNSIVAEVAEVSISNDQTLNVHKVVCVIDCGQTVNPDTVKAQMEGSIVFGLTAALYGEITFEDGRVQQSNFHDYEMLRINEMPEIDVHIIDNDEEVGGAGEPGVPPIAPAVANALYRLTGKRVRSLPIRAEDLVKSDT